MKRKSNDNRNKGKATGNQSRTIPATRKSAGKPDTQTSAPGRESFKQIDIRSNAGRGGSNIRNDSAGSGQGKGSIRGKAEGSESRQLRAEVSTESGLNYSKMPEAAKPPNLRDFFAAASLQGMLGNEEVSGISTDMTQKFLAKHAFQMADKMLKARKA